jgi:hypothetical protein
MKIPKHENRFKRRLVREITDTLGPSWLPLTHTEPRIYGRPDITLSGAGRTTWWELKHATPNFTTMDIQELTCRRLAEASFCRYILFYEHDDNKSTIIAHPNEVYGHKGKTRGLVYELTWDGHNYPALVDYMRDVHEAVLR